MSEITYDEFLKVEMRVGTVLSAERVPKSEKLLKLQLNFGEAGERQIVAGIGKDYTPEELVGKQLTAVLNLAPRKLMGVESHGMILAAHSPEVRNHEKNPNPNCLRCLGSGFDNADENNGFNCECTFQIIPARLGLATVPGASNGSQLG